MYVREIKIRRGIGTWDKPWKVYSYWQVVRSYRDPDTGKVRKQVVKHLGPQPDRDSAAIVARMWGVLCGADGCGNEGTEERIGRPVNRGRKSKHYGGPSFGGPLERTLKLCEKHAADLDAGATLMSVGFVPTFA